MVTKCKCSPAWNATRNLSGVPIARVSRTRRPSSSNWRRCLQALRARWGKWNPNHRLGRPRRSARCAGSTRSRSWPPVKCARMRPFSTSTRYQTLCHCLGSRHASCASAVTRSAHIFRLAGQRNQTGLIWPIICRDERARPADDARQYMRVGVRGFMKIALTCFALLVASGTTMAQQEFGLSDANVTRAVNELSGEMLE